MTIKKVLIIAGGTGGHIFPALVIADALSEKGITVEWLGAQVGMEQKLVGHRYPLRLLPVQAIRGKSLTGKLLAPFRLLRCLYLALTWIKKIHPDVVVGMGGYASGPGSIAAWLLRKPLIIHEQNAIPGLTNRILSRFANVVLQAFPKTFPESSKAQTVGNPVRPALYALPAVSVRFQMPLLPLHVLVLGGSQGARAINEAIQKVLPLLTPDTPVVFWHQTGSRDLDQAKATYQSYPQYCFRMESFIEDMPAAYAWAHLVICRAGALTVSELMAAGVCSVLVPFPQAVDDHQTANAKHLTNNDAGLLIPQKQLTPRELVRVLSNFCQAPQQLAIMAERAHALAKKESVAKIVSIICTQVLDCA